MSVAGTSAVVTCGFVFVAPVPGSVVTVSPAGRAHSESASADGGTTSIEAVGNCGSACSAPQWAVAVIGPVVPGAVTSTARSISPPGSTAPNLHSTVVPCSRTQLASPGMFWRKVDPSGMSSRSSTSCTPTGPVFVKVVVKATVWPTVTGSGPAVSVALMVASEPAADGAVSAVAASAARTMIHLDGRTVSMLARTPESVKLEWAPGSGRGRRPRSGRRRPRRASRARAARGREPRAVRDARCSVATAARRALLDDPTRLVVDQLAGALRDAVGPAGEQHRLVIRAGQHRDRPDLRRTCPSGPPSGGRSGLPARGRTRRRWSGRRRRPPRPPVLRACRSGGRAGTRPMYP